MNHTHFGCYAIIRKGDAIALIRKARGPYTGLLDLPGGTPDFGESPEGTVIREVREEIGLSVSRVQLLNCESATYPYVRDGQACCLHHIGLIFACEVTGHSLNGEGDGLDSDGGLWHPIHDIDERTQTPFVLRALKYLAGEDSGDSAE